LCGKFTLAIFGVWAFEPPEPYTVTENWFTVTLTVFAASFYAYLAGIIVELVYRRSESAREINGKMDGLLTYLETINYPFEKRARFKKFFWQIKPYFMHQYFHGLLPHLSPELNGELALFNHGKYFQRVSWLNCTDDEESVRFKTRLSGNLEIRAYCSGEHIIVLSLHFIIEGLVGCRLKLLREYQYFGEMQCLGGNSVSAGSARALTFTACAVMSTEHFWAILNTDHFPKTLIVVRKALALANFKRIMRTIVQSRKVVKMACGNVGAAPGWKKHEMDQYREMVLSLSRTGDTDEHERIVHDYRALTGASVDNDYATVKALAREDSSKIENRDLDTELMVRANQQVCLKVKDMNFVSTCLFF
jgi:hypothetical protein